MQILDLLASTIVWANFSKLIDPFISLSSVKRFYWFCSFGDWYNIPEVFFLTISFTLAANTLPVCLSQKRSVPYINLVPDYSMYRNHMHSSFWDIRLSVYLLFYYRHVRLTLHPSLMLSKCLFVQLRKYLRLHLNSYKISDNSLTAICLIWPLLRGQVLLEVSCD